MPKITLNNIGTLEDNSALTKLNENFQTIVAEFDNVPSRDGTSPSAMLADLDMNSNQILNLPDATTDQEPLTYGQFNVYYADILSKAAQVTSDKNAVESLYDQFDDRYLGSKAVAPTNDNDGNTLLVGAIYWDNIKQNLYFWNGSAWESPVEECLAILDNFDDIYLGPKTSDPVTDNDGDPLNEGDVYWNSVTKELKIYNGSSWSSIALFDQSLNTTDNVTFAGVTINGNVSVTGNVDGRDVSVDGSKLDGIEANADVTDTTNVTAAGALMDSELTSLSGVKTLTVPDNTTISTFGASLVDDADAATARTTLGVDPAGTDNSTDVTLAGTGTYLSILGQTITVDPITESDISDLGAYLENVVEDTTPQLGGNLDMNGHNITASGGTATSISHTGSGSLTVSAANGGLNLTTTQSNANITINPHGTGNVLVGNYTFDGDQTVGAGQDNYVLTYDNASGLISLEAGAVTSVNGQTGVVVLDADDIDDTSTTNKFADTSSVTAAGAVMDSELTSLSGIKTLTVPDNTTISSFGATLIDDASATAAQATLGIREVLTANRNYFVRTDGSDSNNGLSDSSGGAFLTIQKAMDVIASDLDLGPYNVTVFIRNGTYTGGLVLKTYRASSGTVTFIGDTTTPSNVVISTTGTSAVKGEQPGLFTILGIKVETTTSGSGFDFNNPGLTVTSAWIEFGACASNGCIVNLSASLNFVGPISVTGSSDVGWWATRRGTIILSGQTITYTGTIAYSINVYASEKGWIDAFSMGFTVGGATITGQRYLASGLAGIYINTNPVDPNYFPGSTSGSTANGGVYY